MKLIEALQAINKNRAENGPGNLVVFRVGLSSGFVPLHLKTFLAAHMTALRPNRTVDVLEGIYGDITGNLERLKAHNCHAILAVIEWADLDARLGPRSTGGWQPAKLSEIVSGAQAKLRSISAALTDLGNMPRIVAGPTLPLPPVFYSRPGRLSSFEAQLRAAVAEFHRTLVARSIVVVAPQAIDSVSPLAARLDLKSELAAGFPYTFEHAEALARLLAAEAFPPARRKGLITDLDDTLWQGILGETGIEGVCWTLDRHAQAHGLYQQLLASLASSGTLVAIASRNDPEFVAQALARQDLLVSGETFFPVEAHWGPKSQSVARVLKAWNVGADSVIFVDDSPMELAEVKAEHPEIECVLFPAHDPARFWDFLVQLRERFGASELTREDSLRLESLRSRAAAESAADSSAGSEAFLRDARAEICFASGSRIDGRRAFELLNKTNQFNVNGRRLTETEWAALNLDGNCRFVITADYSDRYGPLGNIAVLVGSAENGKVTVDYWVMSCRAFARRIEHRCLQFLLERFSASEIILRFRPTPRNGPAREFVSALLGEAPSGDVILSKALFEKNCPPLYHSIREI